MTRLRLGTGCRRAILGIDQAAYHGGGLNGKNVQQMLQESDKNGLVPRAPSPGG
jgi:hypothetical protein